MNGSQSVNTLPCNRSVIIADSRFRTDDENESPYDFTADMGGTGIYAKELYYQKLYWNQPLFSHNNSNNELRFQMNEDDSVTYVVYATPFLMYTQYDGNPTGTSLLPPREFSYADNMEKALNGDVRTIPLNIVLVNGDGIVRDSLGNQIQINFRYSPSKGFCIYPVQNPNSGLTYTIKLLPCSYISNAHYVHGFGVYDSTNPALGYVPVSMWTCVYWSDVSPNLLPLRYVVIQSAELNKDRRMISFHNGNFSNFVNELGLFSLNPLYTGVYHEDGVGDDATVVSFRNDYKPQRFRIQILNEFGNVLRCGDPIKNLLTSGLYPDILATFMSQSLRNRGNHVFTDLIVFGAYEPLPNDISKTMTCTLKTSNTLEQPLSMRPLGNIQSTFGGVDPFFNASYWVPIWTNNDLTPPNASYGVGFSSNTIDAPWLPNLSTAYYSEFTYFEQFNPTPMIAIDVKWDSVNTNVPSKVQRIMLVMFDASPTNNSTGTENLGVLYFTELLVDVGAAMNTPILSTNNYLMQRNISYNPAPKPMGRKVGFALTFDILNATPVFDISELIGFNSLGAQQFFKIMSYKNQASVQIDYIPPNTNANFYQFGDPLADGMCEEVVHEIATMLEFS